ncbi:unnamed protein product [Phaedon cochleariae]|uniref:2',5'-phosphodiesterase 12 n=1 Tax=Phaedon cochleariae TaxID=80249 RepID=A0A9P0DT69_PHACE|nr:unnamed protein product [Phaedon cochleariae]
MLFRFLKLPKLLLGQKFIHKYIFNMEKAYLRYLGEDSNQFEFSFKYKNEDLKIDRQFNFCRKLSENVEVFLSRVTTNVGKIVNKKSKKKMKKENNIQLDQTVTALLYLGDKELEKTKLCSDVFQIGNHNIVFKLLDRNYEVIINSPWVDSMSLPMSILANFPTYPSKFDTVFTDKELSEFTWSKSVDDTTWTHVGKGFIYIPTNEDINHYLKLSCVPKNENSEGPTAEAVSVCKVDASPGQCPFETRHNFTRERARDNEFRVVTYNILADLYCDSDYTRTVLHPYCPPYALDIDYRKQLIFKEIIGYNADIICLQEVDRKLYQYDLQPVLSHLGYQSKFFTKGNEVAEGLALFFYSKRFNLMESHRLVFSEHISTDKLFADLWENIEKNENLAKRILARSTTLQTNVLDVVDRDEVLVVANTHLYFHPDADHIRLLHAGLAIKYLENFITELRKKIPRKRISLIFCGDFNSSPDCGIYKLFSEGHLPSDFKDYQSNKEESINGIELKQPFKLASACGTPKYTNYTSMFADCLDYIYYETSNLAVSQVVPLPSHEEVTEHTALPSIVFPSDHIALISDMKWL